MLAFPLCDEEAAVQDYPMVIALICEICEKLTVMGSEEPVCRLTRLWSG